MRLETHLHFFLYNQKDITSVVYKSEIENAAERKKGDSSFAIPTIATLPKKAGNFFPSDYETKNTRQRVTR